MNELVSIIIPTKNSANTIDKCLKSIDDQTYANIEVILVDNFSNDDTIDIAKKYGAKIIEDSSIRTKARNIGSERSKGIFILSIDSDMELTEKVVEECVKKSNMSDSIIIPEISYGTGFWAKCKGLEKRCYIGDNTIEAARFFNKEVFMVVRGYDVTLEAGEDWDIHQRIKKEGFSIGRTESLIMHNEGNLSLSKTMKKKYQYGKTLDNYKKKHSEDFSKQSKFLRPAFVRNWKLFIKNPVVSFGMLFMKLCEFASFGIGYISNGKIEKE